MSRAIVLEGNPVDGYRYHGPFESRNEAIEWSDKWCADTSWVHTLLDPEQSETL